MPANSQRRSRSRRCERCTPRPPRRRRGGGRRSRRRERARHVPGLGSARGQCPHDRRCGRAEALAELYGTPLVVYCEQTLRRQARLGCGRRRPRRLRDEGVPECRAAAPAPGGGHRCRRRLVGRARVRPRRRLSRRGDRRPRQQQGRCLPPTGGRRRRDGRPGRARRSGAGGGRGRPRALVRVTLGVDADTHEAIRTGHHGSKFGLPPDQAHALSRRAGTRARRPRAARARRFTARRLRRAGRDDRPPRVVRRTLPKDAGWTPRVADLGGGFGIRHNPDEHAPEAAVLAASAAETARTAFAEAGLPAPEVWLEPGRSLVGTAGVTLYRVGTVKRLPGRTWAAVDGGMSDNPRPSSTRRGTRRSRPAGRTSRRTST